jgi:hypothetical protein
MDSKKPKKSGKTRVRRYKIYAKSDNLWPKWGKNSQADDYLPIEPLNSADFVKVPVWD